MLRDQLLELLEPVVIGVGYELWELEYVTRPGGGLLRLYIDSSAGIGLDDCERVSRAVSAAMDHADPIAGAYTLEVSSPGLDRVLRTQRHFAHCIAALVRVELSTPLNGRKRFSGRLLDVQAGQITLQVDDRRVDLPIEAIHRARVVPEV
jgi:ribosome maturation factor RimP